MELLCHRISNKECSRPLRLTEVVRAGEVGGLRLRLELQPRRRGGVVDDLQLVVRPPRGHQQLPPLPVEPDPVAAHLPRYSSQIKGDELCPKGEDVKVNPCGKG